MVRLAASIGFFGVFVLTGCSSDTTTTDAALSQQEDAGPVSTTIAISLPSTTSSTVAQSTTTGATEDVLFNDEFETDEGWRYGIEVVYRLPSIDGSPGGCIPTAPPGSLNGAFVVTVTNLIGDRPSPYPPTLFSSNVTKDGTTVQDGGLFGNPTGGLDTVEVFPNEPARLALCGLDASVVAAGLGEIEPEGFVEFNVTVGPVEQEEVESLELGLRFFGVDGGMLDAFMTTVPDSGTWVTAE
jgi:hypothetical protein